MESQRRRSQRHAPAAAAATPTRRSQRLADRRTAQEQQQQQQQTEQRGKAAAQPTSTAAGGEDLLQAAMASSRARGRRRNAVIAADKRPSTPAAVTPLPCRPAGLWDLLPPEVLDIILERCSAKQLAMLETSCSYFRRTRTVQTIAETRLRAIPRAKGTVPDPKAHETYTSLLHFILSQSAAAAQATAIAFGANHAAALLLTSEDNKAGHHSLFTAGRGFYGQLGHGDHEPLAAFKELCIGYQPCVDQPDMEEEITPAVVACGSDYTATITRRGQLLTWGLGNRGELGHEMNVHAGEVTFPLRCTLFGSPDLRIVSVACGHSHTLAIAETGTVWSCGRNGDGQLGNASFADSMQLKRVVGMKGHRVVSCAAGAAHSLALASDGSLFTWGSGKYGQLGHSSLHAVHIMMPEQPIVLATPHKIASLEPNMLKPWRRVTSIAAGSHHSAAVTVSGALLVFGRNSHGQLSSGDNNHCWGPTEVKFSAAPEDPNINYRAVQVVAGLQHTLALIAHRGKVTPYATGNNLWGQLGLGHQKPTDRFVPIAKLPSDVVALQAGGSSSAAICADGRLFVWGRNDHGALGIGHDSSKWAPTHVPGFIAVHPDKTLRKSSRTAPRFRRISVAAAPPAPIVKHARAGGACNDACAARTPLGDRTTGQLPAST